MGEATKSSIWQRSISFAESAAKEVNQNERTCRISEPLGTCPDVLLSRMRGSLFAGRNDSAVIGCVRNDSRRGKRNHWHLLLHLLCLLTLSQAWHLNGAGGKWVIPIGIVILAVACFAFAVSNSTAANAGRLFQGAGSAFAFTGGVYLATHGFSARRLATAMGVTQCLGMLGRWAGQSVVGPMIHREVPWQTIWNVLGVASLVTGVLLFIVTPVGKLPVIQASAAHSSLLRPHGIVFSNPQSYLCGLVAVRLTANEAN